METLLTPLHRYVSAFNSRNAELMASVFSPALCTIHPGEPDVDVREAGPFLQRMQGLWPKNVRYQLRRFITSGDLDAVGEVWGELLLLDADSRPLASEVVLYRIREGLVSEICVYKQMHPSHPDYQ